MAVFIISLQLIEKSRFAYFKLLLRSTLNKTENNNLICYMPTFSDRHSKLY